MNAALVNQAIELPAQYQPYTVTTTQHVVENVEQPIMQPVIQPVIQRIIRQPQNVVNTIVERRVQPIIHRQIQQQLETVVEQGKSPAPMRNAAVVQEEQLQPIVEEVRETK